MSDLFLKNKSMTLNGDESSINLTEILNGGSTKGPSTKLSNSVTSSAMPYMNVNELSATSLYSQNGGRADDLTSSFMPNLQGGSYSATSNVSKINTSDVNNLLSMLSSDSNVSESNLSNKLNTLLQNGGAPDTTETEELENEIYGMMGGNPVTSGLVTLAALGVTGALSEKYAKDSEVSPLKMLGNVLNKSASTLSNMIRKPIQSRPDQSRPDQSRPVFPQENVFMKNTENLSDSMSTTTTINNNDQFSATSSAMPFDPRVGSRNVSSATSNANMTAMEDLVGGNNPALVAFRALAKMVVNELGIKGGPVAMSVAGQLKRDLEAKNPKISYDDLVSEGKKHLLANKSKYMKLADEKKRNK